VKQALRDSYGRVADDLRISVTDRCNFRCIYCMPAEGLKWLSRENILSLEEIHRLALWSVTTRSAGVTQVPCRPHVQWHAWRGRAGTR
jgi:molybdenum cofactor biosynthesis enzyme MoaA